MKSPKALSRREVLQTAGMPGIAAGASEVAFAQHQSGLYFAKESGLVTGKMKPLKYEEIPGLLTKEQVTPHYQAHYGGALKRLTTIEQQLDGLYRGKEPLGGDALTFMHKDKINRMNSVLLHELYFDGLTPKSGSPAEDIAALLASGSARLIGGPKISKHAAWPQTAGECSHATLQTGNYTTCRATYTKSASFGLVNR